MPEATDRYVIAPPPVAALPVDGSDELFPVNRIFCIGRNYAAHAVEMGHDPDKEPPFFFLKSADALATAGEFPYPPKTSDVHHEVELVVALGRGGRDIAVAHALDHVWGYAVGLDMTRRDLQNEAKKTGRPWDMGKGFDQSAPCSAVRPASRIGHPAKGAIWVKVNGQMRQSGDLAQQIWSVPETIACLSGLVTLAPGDLVFTGTPDGVGPVQPGDRLEGGIDGIGDLVVTYR
jgi:fumarylpyruvate hydrolase